MENHWRTLAVLLATAFLAGCAGLPANTRVDDIGISPWASESTQTAVPAVAAAPAATRVVGWHHLTFPGKSPTSFGYARKDGRHAIAVTASASASMLRNRIRIEPSQLESVRFSWKVPELIAGADMALRDADDAPVRIVLVFEGDRSRFSARDAMLSELMRTLTGEEMPYATLMYVWCNKRPPGSVITSPRTNRIRKLVVESGAGNLGQWLDYDRNIRADFERAFGEAPGALVAIGVMTDSDNTRATTTAWYGPVRLAPSRRPAGR